VSALRVQALEVNAVHHCNLACVCCSHASPVAPRQLADPVRTGHDLAGLAGVVAVDHIKVVGSEPFCQLAPGGGRLRAPADAALTQLASADRRVS
jgi:hypothetical protein